MPNINRWGPDIRSGRFDDPTYWRTARARFLDHRQVSDIVAKSVRDPRDFWATYDDEPGGPVIEQLSELLIAELKDARGLHAETFLATLGAAAGFACQMAIRELYGLPGRVNDQVLFLVVDTSDGNKYYFGNFLNSFISEPHDGASCIWAVVRDHLLYNKRPVFELEPLFTHNASSLGNPTYGRPDVAIQHLPHNHPEDLLWKYWHVLRYTLVMHKKKPSVWPLTLAMTTLTMMHRASEVLAPEVAARLVMEAVIAMSKIDPDRVDRAWFHGEPKGASPE